MRERERERLDVTLAVWIIVVPPPWRRKRNGRALKGVCEVAFDTVVFFERQVLLAPDASLACSGVREEEETQDQKHYCALSVVSAL